MAADPPESALCAPIPRCAPCPGGGAAAHGLSRRATGRFALTSKHDTLQVGFQKPGGAGMRQPGAG
ncbi:hypothetical protein XFF6990_330019 [Xanthomonas citri pv. fuscans]|nr:hypothetical protein XFF6990_330019 [Xanthomonas citri pv. fuscans]